VTAGLLAGRYPDDVGALVAAGVRTFVDLRAEGAPYAVPSGVVYRRFGIPDFGCPTAGQVREVLDAIEVAEGVVYLHCRGGCGRTGTVLGCFLVEQGLSADEALARVRELTGGNCPETAEQETLVRGWSPVLQ
jgi:protein-tyrosine phosphatase